MNDLVSEYQQYQDATAEGMFDMDFYRLCIYLVCFIEEGEGGEGEEEETKCVNDHHLQIELFYFLF